MASRRRTCWRFVNIASGTGCSGHYSVLARAARRLQLWASTNRALFRQLAFVVLSVWLALTWYTTIRRIVACYMPLPFMDYWRVVVDYQQIQVHNFRVLWVQHNEHRIVFPELVFLLDMFVWHGREFLSLAVSFLCYFSIWLVIAWTVSTDTSLPRCHRALAILLAGIVIGYKGSASALAIPFLLQWTLTQLASILSLLFITFARGRNVLLVLAIAMAVITTYSSGNGMLLWPVLVAAGFLLRLRKRQIFAIAASGVLSIWLYFVGYRFSGDLQLANFYRHPLYSLSFLGAYLSMPFGATKSSGLGVYLGLANLVAAISLFLCAVRNRLLQTRVAVVLFGSYIFTLLTAIITAAGRMDVADSTFRLAKADRYLTVPLANWGVLIALCLWVAARLRWKILSPPVLAVCLAVLLAVGSRNLREWIHASDEGFADTQAAMLSFETDLAVPALMPRIFPDPRLIRLYLPVLENNHLSIYYKDRSNWLGEPVSRFHPVATGAAAGAVTKTVPVASGMEVFGWADDGRDSPRYRWIVLVNEAGRIAGFGERLPAGSGSDLAAQNVPHLLGWVGFVNSKVAGGPFRAYLVDPQRKELVPIPGARF